MAILSSNITKDVAELYQGYNTREVGLGLIDPNIYANQQYREKKIQKLIIGGLSDIIYTGMEHDRSPLVIPIMYEPAYATILGYNLHYVPLNVRQKILKYVLDSNAARIRANQPIIVDYNGLKRNVPASPFIVRRYKVVGVRVTETYKLTDWPDAIKGNYQWANHYRHGMPKR